jgi:GNAT superfamily N-acetyltransferase
MSARITIDAFDPATADAAAVRQYYEFAAAMDLEIEPDDPVAPFDVAMFDYREPPSWSRVPRWVARDGSSGDIVGHAWLELEYVETNRHLAWCDVVVRADHRRQGIGSRLLSEVAAAAAADGRSVLGASVGGEDPAGTDAPFLASFGFDQRMVERRSRLLVRELDRSMMEDWVASAKERASDYSLIGFDDVCPDELLEAYVVVNDVMNTAPKENLDMDDWHLTPERVREREARRAKRRGHQWTLIARHDPTGDLAGFTEVGFADWMSDLMWQGDTGVDPAHREKGLGRWLKAAMALRVLDERPEVGRIDTWNAGSNRPMLAINIAMGFRPVKYYGDWQVNIDSLQL